MDAIKYVSNEKSEITAIIIDLEVLKIHKQNKEDVFKALDHLNELISNAPEKKIKNSSNWESAKGVLRPKDFK